MLIGATRSMQQDAPYALRQLADVALKALSPDINDPTTTQDATFHLAAVLAELIRRDPPQPVVTERDGRHLVAAQQSTPVDLVQLAFAETRRAAAEHPAVCIYLLEAIELVVEPLVTGMTDRATPLLAEAALVIDGCRAALVPGDLRDIEDAYRRRFDPDPMAQARGEGARTRWC
jgi:uncharacterized membrane protein